MDAHWTVRAIWTRLAAISRATEVRCGGGRFPPEGPGNARLRNYAAAAARGARADDFRIEPAARRFARPSEFAVFVPFFHNVHSVSGVLYAGGETPGLARDDGI